MTMEFCETYSGLYANKAIRQMSMKFCQTYSDLYILTMNKDRTRGSVKLW